MEELRVLILSDLHYIGKAEHVCSISKRKANFGLEFLKKAIYSEKDNIDLIVITGDIVDNGKAKKANEDLISIKKEIEKFEIPVMIVPGNHDGNSKKALEIFGDYEGIHEIKGYSLISFSDEYDEKDICSRDFFKMERFFNEMGNDSPIVVFQHNPIYPKIESTYPYNISRADEVAKIYANKKVLLSISGHAHWGVDLKEYDGVGYYTCPALCEYPFSYTVLSMKGKEYRIDRFNLSVPDGLMDYHVHTHLAYCSDNTMLPENVLKFSEALGLKKICFTEHIAQLYVSSDDYWSGRFVNYPELLERNLNSDLDRISQYLESVKKFSSKDIQVGVEAEVDKTGKLFIASRDIKNWDIILGAVHFIPERFEDNMKTGFMWANEKLMDNGIDVLAHPFRFFRKNRADTPTELYKPIARMLKDSNTAAEVNFHINEPDIEFFRICTQEGVRIVWGSDSHELYELGFNKNYFNFLRNIIYN